MIIWLHVFKILHGSVFVLEWARTAYHFIELTTSCEFLVGDQESVFVVMP